MNYRLSLILFTFILYPLANFAQIENDVRYYEAGFNTVTINAKSIGLKGSPFLFDNAIYGDITLSSGKEYIKMPFNLEIVRGELVIKTENEDSSPVPVRNWQSVETKDEFPRKFSVENIDGLFRIVEEIGELNGFSIIALHSKKLFKPDNIPDSYSSPQYDTFVHSISFYKVKGLQKQHIKPNQLVNEIGGKEIKEFIKSNKLKIDDPVDLKRILNFLK